MTHTCDATAPGVICHCGATLVAGVRISRTTALWLSCTEPETPPVRLSLVALTRAVATVLQWPVGRIIAMETSAARRVALVVGRDQIVGLITVTRLDQRMLYESARSGSAVRDRRDFG